MKKLMSFRHMPLQIGELIERSLRDRRFLLLQIVIELLGIIAEEIDSIFFVRFERFEFDRVEIEKGIVKDNAWHFLLAYCTFV